MKNLKSLSKKLFLISFIFIFMSNIFAEDKPSDIWNITEQQTQGQLIQKISLKIMINRIMKF